jgi:hypothetical protein
MAWTNDTKDWSYEQPLHRIKSPSHNRRGQADGRGYPRGCHAESDGPNDSLYGQMIQGLARAIPGWVSVESEDQEQELEGTLERCFQTWTDVPLFQWHRYYDWNFHVIPAEGYRYVLGSGNEVPPEVVIGATDRRITTQSMECEWDCGAFGPRPGLMFDNAQWIWPMAGQYCWMAGRWIYDCGHASSPNKNTGLMRSELHPVKAMATAQWEAVSFPENGNLYVPGIRFLFIASQLGGYKQFNAINDRDYEFILDLPKNQGMASPWLLGHTPDFPLNTGVLRAPHLLHKVQFLNTQMGAPGNVEPVWEPIPATTPGRLPEQIKIKIPLTQMPMDKASYGVIINFGWFDPDQSQARRVKRCQIRFDHLHKASVNHDVGAEEWTIKFGANGRWYLRTFNDVHNDRNYPLDVTVPDFYLADTDSIYISSHGAERDQMDEVFDRSVQDRTLQLNDDDVQWDRDIVLGTADPEHNAVNRRRLWDMVYAAAGMLPGGDAILNFLGIEDSRANNPLGIIDPAPPGAANPHPKNPLPVRDEYMEGAFRHQVAYYAQEMGESAELVEHRSRVDYELHYELTVKPQLA